MAPFAVFLKSLGIDVTGSDENVYPPMSDLLIRNGIQIFQGYRAENLIHLPKKPDLIIIGNVIQKINPEAQATLSGDYIYSSLPEVLENLVLPQTKNIVVCGTHGKTTTSSLMAHILRSSHHNPSYFVGGVAHDLPVSFNIEKASAGSYFVLEGDEYDTAFWDKVPKFFHYLPDHAILTSVEFDHADIYSDLGAVEKAFEGLFSRIRTGGSLIACVDYPSVVKLLPQAKVAVTTYASPKNSDAAHFTFDHVLDENGFTRFDVIDVLAGRKIIATLSVKLPGEHNVLNALAAYLQATQLGIPSAQVVDAIGSFRGVKRRQEIRGEVGGVTIIDDFAHHPTAVIETLKALRKRYSGQRLLTVFEPRSAASRRKVFQNAYAEAFRQADLVFISKPYDQTKIALDDQFSSQQLIDDLKSHGVDARIMESVEQGVIDVSHSAKSGDVIAVLSNGGFGGFIDKLLTQKSTHP
jgi:UDP-N-acetylmuramate: L-alanyl-gamma-D-glutamyl-meso-diaminopimelate ligase